jgi:hypothetical protein
MRGEIKTATLAALLFAAALAAAGAAKRDRAPSDSERDKLRELARRFRDAQSEVGVNGQPLLRRAVWRLRDYGFRTDDLAEMCIALSLECPMESTVLDELQSILDALAQMGVAAADGAKIAVS